MDIDKRINKDERKVMEYIQELCGVSFRRVDMKSVDKIENIYNFNKEGIMIMLGLDLTQLNLDENRLEILGESVIKFKNLERFLIRSTENKILPRWIKELKNIDALILKNSYLTNIPEWLREFNNITVLNLAHNEIKNLPEWILTLPKLKELNLSSKKPILELNQENTEIIKALHEKNIKLINSIFKMHITLGIPNDQIKVVREIKNQLGDNIVYGSNIDSIDDPLRNLNRYGIDLRIVKGKIAQMGIYQFRLKELPESFGKLDGLTKLKITENKLESLPESFGELKDLKELDLSNNQLTSLPDSFVNLTSITKLNLSNNQFTEIPTQIWALKELTDLDLSNNPFSEEENSIIQKVPDLIRKYLRKKATIRVFVSHAVIDFEPYHIGDLVNYLENQKEISQVFFCEEDLAGNIDEWMLDAVQKCQLILFIGTQKSVFNSPDCANELQLADKFAIPVIPLKGSDIDWPDLAEINLSRELGLEFDKENFNEFCSNLYKYILNVKQEINLMDKEARHKGITDIYERFRLMLEETISDVKRKVDLLAERISKLEEKIN